MKRWMCGLTMVILAVPAYADQPAPAATELVLISSHWEGIRRETTRAFTEVWQQAHPDRPIQLRWLELGGTSDILRFIKGEYAAKGGSIGVDLFFGGGIDPYEELASRGLLESVSLSDKVLEGLPVEIGGFRLRDEQNRWFAAALSTFGILYNKRVLTIEGLPEPKTWEDVAVPAVHSWVAFADPRKSGSAHAIVEVILQAYGWNRGWEILRAIGRNSRSFTGSSSQVPKEVAVGESAYGFLIDSYGREAVKQAGSANLGFMTPTELSTMTGDGIAILKGAPHREAATEFLQFILSEAGQRLFLAKKGTPGGPVEFELGKFSVRPALYDQLGSQASLPENPFNHPPGFRYDTAKATKRYDIINDLIGTCIIDADLPNATRCEKYPCDHDAAPSAEAEIARLATEWQNPGVRQTTIRAGRDSCTPTAGSTRNLRGIILTTLLLAVLFVVRLRRPPPAPSK